MTIDTHAFNTCPEPLAYDPLTEAIARAIGANDPYPTDAQKTAHRTKQLCNERFLNIEWKEVAQ